MELFGLKGRNAMIAWVVIGLVVLFLVLGLYYLMRPQLFVISSQGRDSTHSFTTSTAAYAAAKSWGLTVATQQQLQDAYNKGASTCVSGFVQGDGFGWPQQGLLPTGSGSGMCGVEGINYTSTSSVTSPIGVWVYGNKFLATRKFPSSVMWPWNDYGFQKKGQQYYKPIYKF